MPERVLCGVNSTFSYLSRKSVPIFLFLLATVIFSCKTYKSFHITLYEPAEISLPPHIQRLLLVHTIPPTGKGMRYSIYSEEYTDSVYLDTLAAYYSLEKVAEVLSSTERFKGVFPESEDQNMIAQTFANNHLSATILKDLARKYQIDGVLVLETMQHLISYKAEVGRIGFYISFFEISLSTRWGLYDAHNMIKLDEKVIDNFQRYRWDGIWGLLDEELFYSGRELYLAAAEEAGESYAMRISPHLATQKRIVFHRGNRHIRKGYHKALQGDWTGAYEIWNKSTQHTSAIIRARGKFNMALAAEMNGELPQAMRHAEESHRIYPDTLNKSYLLILKERQEKLAVLLEQLGVK